MDKGNILESWKAIAAHLDRNVRTCQLWEREMGLPIHRLDGSPKARVFAYPAELDRWLDEKLHEHDRNPRPNGKKGQATLPTLPAWNIGLIAGLAVLAIAAIGTSAWLLRRQSRIRWANDVAVPEIERLVKTSDGVAAYDLFLEVERIIPRAPRLATLRLLVESTVSFVSAPPGAAISIKGYSANDTSWQSLGLSPVAKARTYQGYKRWKAEMAGFASVEGATMASPGFERKIRIVLDKLSAAPPGMVRVMGKNFQTRTPNLAELPEIELKDYYIDRFEVTNRQFQEFVDAGGYGNRALWMVPFVKDGRQVPWAEGIREFVDGSGRPGPAAWRNGGYPEGQADFPVSGVSWYEAAAYAEFAGKKLPSYAHWEYAAGNYFEDSGYSVPASNFNEKGPAPVGRYKGMSPSGAYDMAGNVKEWCWNDVDGKRLIRGGAWNEAQYMFMEPDNYAPFMRAGNFGFRCMEDIPGAESPAEAFGPLLVPPLPNFSKMTPCSDEVFAIYRSLYGYAKTDLAPKIESSLEWSDDTIVEKVTVNDATGEDRLPMYLFLPRRGRPPFQTIVYYPGGAAWTMNSVFQYGSFHNRAVELFTRGGRAFVLPLFQGTFGRTGPPSRPDSVNLRRETSIHEYRDLARCLDYLETRPELDHERIAYQGLSGGASYGVVFIALEKRFRAAVLTSGGLFAGEYMPPSLYTPERDLINFAPHVHIPVLMQNGRYDFLLPWETAIKPLFELLGSPAKDKNLIAYESGHNVGWHNNHRKDIFDFLDKYLGPAGMPVATGSAGR